MKGSAEKRSERLVLVVAPVVVDASMKGSAEKRSELFVRVVHLLVVPASMKGSAEKRSEFGSDAIRAASILPR